MFGKKSETKVCPLLKKDCIGAKCMWWTELLERDVKEGTIKQLGNCAVSTLPGLLAGNIQHIDGVQASVDAQRKEIRESQARFLEMEKEKVQLATQHLKLREVK